MNQMANIEAGRKRKPEWLKTRIPGGDAYFALKNRLGERGLQTICQNARCPNIHECWNGNQATFLIMGSLCTRDCGFCAVASGKPLPLDLDEGRKLAEMADLMKLRYAVITSVTRDDLPDKGSGHFASVLGAMRRQRPRMRIEVLVPDFSGLPECLDRVLDAGPDVLAHNVETVPALYPRVNRRPDAYGHSLRILEHGKRRGWITKTGLMVGLGETAAEVQELFRDLRRGDHGVDALTIGQYLQPSSRNLPVSRYYSPAEFAALKESALGHGFVGVESGPFVRSSYHADQLYHAVSRALSRIQ
jgi:lipoic acid synthetase